MSKDKIEWAIYTNNENEKQDEIYYADLSKEEYESKYKNNLICINGCEARIKFTHRKNGIKFFSTWNGEGNRHDDGCPFAVKYKGRIGRNKLKAFYEERTINDEDIKKSLLSKIKRIKRKYNGEEENKPKSYSKEVEIIGEMDVLTECEDGRYTSSQDKSKAKREYITSIDAKYLSTAYINARKCVYGEIDNVQIENENGQYFGYINLKNRGYTVAVYLPEAFYSQENDIEVEQFKKLFEILEDEVNKRKKYTIVVCYGVIKRKQKKGVNINVINPDHILINEMSIKEILLQKNLDDVNFKII